MRENLSSPSCASKSSPEEATRAVLSPLKNGITQSPIKCELSPQKGVPLLSPPSQPVSPTPGPSCIVKEENGKQTGGRLKFFKDGHMVLELCCRTEGWVQVTQKTYWPPKKTYWPHTISAIRQESSTSHSVSDDCSSVQSSPWPEAEGLRRKNPNPLHCCSKSTMWLQFKRPPWIWQDKRRQLLGLCRHPTRDVFTSVGIGEADEHGDLLKRRRRKLDTNAKKIRLSALIRKLFKRVNVKCDESVSVWKLFQFNHPSASDTRDKVDHSLISPRKRILREMERGVDDLIIPRRTKVHARTVMNSYQKVSHRSVCQNSITNSSAIYNKQSRYSIESLLGGEDANSVGESDVAGDSSPPVKVMRLEEPVNSTARSEVHSPRLYPPHGQGALSFIHSSSSMATLVGFSHAHSSPSTSLPTYLSPYLSPLHAGRYHSPYSQLPSHPILGVTSVTASYQTPIPAMPSVWNPVLPLPPYFAYPSAGGSNPLASPYNSLASDSLYRFHTTDSDSDVPLNLSKNACKSSSAS